MKEKIPTDIIFFAYNIDASAFGKKVQEYEYSPEIQGVIMEYISLVQSAFSMVGNGHMLTAQGEIEDRNETGLQMGMQGYV